MCLSFVKITIQELYFAFGMKVKIRPVNMRILNKPPHEKTRLCHIYANNRDADQPAHPRSLISIFVCCLDSSISLVFIYEISSLYLASVAAQSGLSLPWSYPEDRFSCDEAQIKLFHIFFQNIMVDEAEDSMLGQANKTNKRSLDSPPSSPGPRKRKPGKKQPLWP